MLGFEDMPATGWDRVPKIDPGRALPRCQGLRIILKCEQNHNVFLARYPGEKQLGIDVAPAESSDSGMSSKPNMSHWVLRTCRNPWPFTIFCTGMLT